MSDDIVTRLNKLAEWQKPFLQALMNGKEVRFATQAELVANDRARAKDALRVWMEMPL